ncbi:MAG: tetratricopeptide repeat protein [Ignavibacteriales bacterium]|nr:tetratricopeptide repeat protein [Ignavibacteriales bacterium]
MIELDPKDGQTWYNRGVSKFDLKDYKGALEDFNKAVELNPKYGKAFYNRALTKQNLDDLKGACEDWTKAAEFGESRAIQDLEKYCSKGK